MELNNILESSVQILLGLSLGVSIINLVILTVLIRKK